MFERLPDGQLWPYVMDFGLAREIEAGNHSTLSNPGVIEGTPAFMSPEQARGEVRRLDRRTDVYGLGATLYALLLGRAPFEGSQMDVLLSVLLQEPTAPRLIDSSLPADLETIIQKCLEKEQARRYDSARAVADDLHRFLDGEPISARPPSALYRIEKSVRKNKLLVFTVGPALVLCLIFGGLMARARLGAQEQAVLAEQLGQDVKEMELLMRYAYGLPLHDIAREQTLIRARMTRLKERSQRASSRDSRALRYALGRGHLVLREYEAARSELEQSWRAGYRSAAASYALGQALGELYRIGFEEARRSGDKRYFEARTYWLKQEYLEPALRYLDGARGEGAATDSPSYLEGLHYLYRKDYAAALPLALAAQREAPWLADPHRLVGDAYREQAIDQIGRGEYKLARTSILAAAENHRAAADIARSDADLHVAEALDFIRLLEIEDATGNPASEPFQRSRDACEHAITANPRSALAHDTKAWAHWRFGIGQWQRGQDPSTALREAQGAAEKALQLEPQNHSAYYSIGVSSYVLGAYLKDRDPEQSLQFTLRAIDAYKQAAALQARAAWYFSELGAAYTLLLEQQARRGRASKETLQKATAALMQAIALEKDYEAPYGNLTSLYLTYAQNQVHYGEDPTSYLDTAQQYGRDALRINGNDFESANALIGVYLSKAEFALLRGGDTRWATGEARALIERSLRMNRNNIQVHTLSAQVAILRASEALQQAQIPELETHVKAGLATLAEAEQLGEKDPNTALLSGRLKLLAARGFLQGRRGPAGAQQWLMAAEQSVQQALALSPGSAEAHELFAQVMWRSGELGLRRGAGRPLHEKLTAGLAHCSDALRIHPRRATTLATAGVLHLLSARLLKAEATNAAAARAVTALEEALHQSSFLQREFGPLLDEARALSDATVKPGR